MREALESLYRSGSQFLIPLTPDETYAHIVEEGKKLIDASYGTVLMMKENVLVRVYTSLPIELESTSRPRGFSYDAFATGQPLVVNAKKIIPHHPELAKINLKSSVMVPLSYYHHALGVLIFAVTKKQHISKKKLQMLKIFGAISSLSIRKTQLYSEAQQALEARDLFVAMISHELRTPITAMNVYAHLLKKKIEHNQGTEARWIGELSAQISMLTRLVNELLNVDLLKTGKFTFEKQIVDMKDILERVTKQFQVSYPYHRLIFKDNAKSGEPIIEADADRIVQMLQNVLENAAKFSSSEKNIVLKLSMKKPNLIVTVSDEGVGIAKKDLPDISKMFYKGQENYKEGVGLGLYISKIIVDEHKGDIKITSIKRKGTKVKITLPLLRI